MMNFATRALVTILAALALVAAFTLSAGAEEMVACYRIPPTGEGFPRIACPLEGATYYRDMDGTDGSYGVNGDGAWTRES